MEIVAVFCQIDGFCLSFEPKYNQMQLNEGKKNRNKPSQMAMSEVMTILVLFHQSNFRNLKAFYTEHICCYQRHNFPYLLSYNRFVELQAKATIYLAAFLQMKMGNCSGISFVDATKIKVCDNLRIKQNKVFKNVGQRGHTSTGWFYGFKIHLIINDCGEILAWQVTSGNVDDRIPVPKMAKQLWGKLFGDKGYISQTLSKVLGEHNLQLVTKLKKNMKNKLMSFFDRLLLRKRAIIESVIDQLKDIFAS